MTCNYKCRVKDSNSKKECPASCTLDSEYGNVIMRSNLNHVGHGDNFLNSARRRTALKDITRRKSGQPVNLFKIFSKKVEKNLLRNILLTSWVK